MGLIPGGAHKNREFFGPKIEFSSTVSLALQDVLFDPQTSGGLLVSLNARHGPALVDAMTRNRTISAAVIGEVVADGGEQISVF
jgi:selenide,water dikinase